MTTEIIGPHVIAPTNQTTKLYLNNRPRGTFTVWECKYCDWSGVHPKHSEVTISIEQGCNGFEWLDSEKHAL